MCKIITINSFVERAKSLPSSPIDFSSLKTKININSNEDKMEHYHKIFDNYEGEHFIFGANQNEFKINSIENMQTKMENKLQKKKGIDFGIQKRVVNFGESPFHIYSDDYNIYSRQFQTLEICSLILHRIENYYGIMSSLSKNEKAKMNKKMSFFNYNLSLTQMGKNKEKEEESDADTNSKKNVPFIKAEEMDDDEVNDYTNIEDITESLYLSAYYHMDRGSGDIIEDISNNKNTAKISCIYNNNPNVETEKKN